MHGECIDEHGDECPHLLGIPSPVASPTYVCPDGSDEDAGSKQKFGRIEEEL